MKKIFENKKLVIGLIVLALIFAVYQLIPKHNVFVRVGDLNYARAAHTATLLNDGRVLIIGGSVAPYRTQRKATIFEEFDKVEVYLPDIKKFKVINQMNENRVAHTATLLKDGNVLIVGGTGSTGEKIYDVNHNKFINVGNLNIKRYGHSAILLDDGNVLIVGGATNGVGFAKEIEIFNPDTRKFKVVGKFELNNNGSIVLKTVNLSKLLDGRILITPVVNKLAIKHGRKNPDYNRSLIYDYKNNSLETLTNFGDTCRYNSTFVAKDGNIYNICSESYISTIIEKYDLKNHSNIKLTNLIQPRQDYLATLAVLTKDNSILILGGRNNDNNGIFTVIFNGIITAPSSVTSVEKYDIKKNEISKVTNKWVYRQCFAITTLQNGKILLTGGSTKDDDRLKLAEEY